MAVGSIKKWTIAAESGRNLVSKSKISPDSAWVWRLSRMTPDGMAEPVSRDHIIRHEPGQGNIHFPCSADHEQDWQPYTVDPYSAMSEEHTYINA